MKPEIEDRKSKVVDWEVLPPEEEKERTGGLEPLFKGLALIMDELIRVPGTRFRFGLDPLIGLVPGLGDTGSALISALALVQATRLGLPRIILARMALNILVNELIGILPVVGDAFSFWFKSNVRNHEIIKEYLASPGTAPRRSDWIFVIGILALLFGIVACGLAISFLFISEFAKAFSSLLKG